MCFYVKPTVADTIIGNVNYQVPFVDMRTNLSIDIVVFSV